MKQLLLLSVFLVIGHKLYVCRGDILKKVPFNLMSDEDKMKTALDDYRIELLDLQFAANDLKRRSCETIAAVLAKNRDWVYGIYLNGRYVARSFFS